MPLSLFRPALCLLNALAGLTGYVLARGHAPVPAALTAVGILLLAGGATALNQAQEAGIDRRMRRTSTRPVASGRCLAPWAAALGGLLALVGTLLLGALSLRAGLAGLAGLLLYNGVYTPLKRHTPLALLPGAVAGALPALIGGLAAPGPLSPALLLAGLLLLWQLPHFWLLAWRYREDYRHAGLPALHDRLNPAQMHRVSLAWLLCLLPAGALLLLFDLPQAAAAKAGFVGTLLLFPWLLPRYEAATAPRLRSAFVQLNLLLAGVLLLLLVDRLLAW